MAGETNDKRGQNIQKQPRRLKIKEIATRAGKSHHILLIPLVYLGRFTFLNLWWYTDSPFEFYRMAEKMRCHKSAHPMHRGLLSSGVSHGGLRAHALPAFSSCYTLPPSSRRDLPEGTIYSQHHYSGFGKFTIMPLSLLMFLSHTDTVRDSATTTGYRYWRLRFIMNDTAAYFCLVYRQRKLLSTSPLKSVEGFIAVSFSRYGPLLFAHLYPAYSTLVDQAATGTLFGTVGDPFEPPSSARSGRTRNLIPGHGVLLTG